MRYLRNTKVASEAEEINNYSTRREVEELYRSLKSENSAFISTRDCKRDEHSKLKEYFQKHFTVKE